MNFKKIASGFAFVFSAFLYADIETDVANLKLGIGEYKIGQVLTQEQLTEIKAKNKFVATNKAKTKKLEDSFGNSVVLRERDNRVIIIYKQFKDVNKSILENSIGNFIIDFGEPTAISHDKILYWTFNKSEKITEEMFQQFKDQTAKTNKKANLIDVLNDGNGSLTSDYSNVKLNNIVTIKLNSDEDISANTEISDANNSKINNKNMSFYIILFANNLIENL